MPSGGLCQSCEMCWRMERLLFGGEAWTWFKGVNLKMLLRKRTAGVRTWGRGAPRGRQVPSEQEDICCWAPGWQGSERGVGQMLRGKDSGPSRAWEVSTCSARWPLQLHSGSMRARTSYVRVDLGGLVGWERTGLRAYALTSEGFRLRNAIFL